jgi:hypothetical protein
MIPTWEGLNRLGHSRVLKTSYVWLLVVPTAARVLKTINSPIVLSGIGEGLRFDLALPFSWRLFYFSAVAISIAGIIHTVACPQLIKNFKTYREFEFEGRGLSYLKSYAENLRRFEFSGDAEKVMTEPHVRLDIPKEWLADVFYQLYNSENVKHRIWRSLCLLLYIIGLGLIGVVLIQNFIYVAKAVWDGASL